MTGVQVTHAELRELVRCAFEVTDLPAAWPEDATTAELEFLAQALGLALSLRHAEWACVVAGGTWPRSFDPPERP